MAYICYKPAGSCSTCEHFRFDEDYGNNVCFAQTDAEEKSSELNICGYDGCDGCLWQHAHDIELCRMEAEKNKKKGELP